MTVILMPMGSTDRNHLIKNTPGATQEPLLAQGNASRALATGSAREARASSYCRDGSWLGRSEGTIEQNLPH